MNKNDFKILIACPSKGRAKTCITHKVLPSVIYFVGEDEYNEYVNEVGERNVRSVGKGFQVAPSGKCKTLNKIIDDYKKDYDVILFTDDDIKYISRIDFITDNGHSVRCTEEELMILIEKMSVIAKKIGAKIGGFSALGGDKDFLRMGLCGNYRMTQKSYIDGKAFLLFDDDGTRFREDLYLKEDVAFNCDSLLKNKRNLCARFVVFVGKALTNKGGVCDVRTKAKEIEQGEKMIDLFGDMLKLQISKKGNGVLKNAVQFGIR